MNKKIVVLISGSGTNLQALIDSIHNNQSIQAEISLVLSNRSAAYGLQRAKEAFIPTKIFALKTFQKKTGLSRTDYDIELAELVNAASPNLIVLAGFMHILSPAFLKKITSPIINLHPALPGEYEGARAIERAHADFVIGKTDHTGVMVHYVIQEVDGGDPIVMKRIDIKSGETLEELENRIHAIEHQLIVDAARKVLSL